MESFTFCLWYFHCCWWWWFVKVVLCVLMPLVYSALKAFCSFTLANSGTFSTKLELFSWLIGTLKSNSDTSVAIAARSTRWRMLKIASKKLTLAKAVVPVLPIKYHYSSQHHQRYSSCNIATSKLKPDEKSFELILSLLLLWLLCDIQWKSCIVACKL